MYVNVLWKCEVSSSLPRQVGGGGGKGIVTNNSLQGPYPISENLSREKSPRMQCKQNLLKNVS